MHIFCHLFVCFQTCVYTLGEFHKNWNNSTVFEELSVSIVDLMDYFLAGGFWKVHIFRHLFVCFQTSVYMWENFIRIGIAVLYLKSWRCQLWIWRSQISVLLAPFRVASKTAFATVKSTIDTLRFASPVKLHLRPSNPQLTPPTLPIQYCYSLNRYIWYIFVWILQFLNNIIYQNQGQYPSDR